MADESTQGGQPEATQGEGVQPAELGYAPPDTGQGDVESEIPVGVDSLDPEKVEAAKAAADEGGDDDGGALDVSAIVSDDDAPADADAEADADADVDAGGDDAPADADAAADDAGDDATEKTDPEATVAPDTGEDE
jgi:hypothetical protein